VSGYEHLQKGSCFWHFGVVWSNQARFRSDIVNTPLCPFGVEV
jgi:hypothetical protein